MKKTEAFLKNVMKQKPIDLSKEKLLELSIRIFREEVKIFNKSFKEVSGLKAFDSYDGLLSQRGIYRSFSDETQTFCKIKVLTEEITDKKLQDIDFRENQIDQLKVRIKLREFFSEILLGTLILRIDNLFKSLK